jgi:tetratricopeptide (TPR) repeat protein
MLGGKMTVEKIYEFLDEGKNEEALELAKRSLSQCSDESPKDQLLYALGYAYVALKNFSAAEALWSQMFDKSKDHKDLHQIAMVKREMGDVQGALELFEKETKIISDDPLAKSINLYELAYCNLLTENLSEAKRHLEKYAEARVGLDDAIEEACFYRLQGDYLSKAQDPGAEEFYQAAKELFLQAGDKVGVREIEARLRS